MQPDAILFTISQHNLSAGRFKVMAGRLEAAINVPSMLVRLEGSSTSLPDALDALVARSHRRILIQPIGLPFTESMRAWLPGAVGNWLERTGRDDLELAIGREVLETTDLLERIAASALDNVDTAEPATTAKTSLGKPGWETPPAFAHHILVCTGPRCHYRDAASMVVALKSEISRQKAGHKCLTTRTGCMFPCNKGPMVAVYPRGEWYRLPDGEAVRQFVRSVIVEETTLPEHLFFSATAKAAIA
ncbi:(2Fe-2S) ferredoxin domain-containing protein [Pelagibacterium sp. H642]|uniref:(2Fe-2S) ferredoxin domain-containing protein n=1 Tax=Pelagibacterium sp. H642 TaxID=1881069 RepID=UPI002815B457|nr:(2Fe-2S) ferredoxin domain-containing protein [Pelagibacterium sp. H642]WMT91014.1 (2Fe-2S) ferredoxin domain-containing protein [Pelagibacterium sp. H642]